MSLDGRIERVERRLGAHRGPEAEARSRRVERVLRAATDEELTQMRPLLGAGTRQAQEDCKAIYGAIARRIGIEE